MKRSKQQIYNNYTFSMNSSFKAWHSISQNETSSHSSKGSHKTTLLTQFHTDILKQTNKNIQKYEKIVKQNPRFYLNQYEKKETNLATQSLSENELSLELDRLLEDECLLDKQLSKMAFDEQQQDQPSAQKQTKMEVDLYSVLRTIWGRKDQIMPSQQKIDSINQKVGAIKAHLKIMSQANDNSSELQQIILNSKQYLETKAKFDTLACNYDSDKARWEEMIKMQEQKIAKLELDNQFYLGKLIAETEKKKKYEEELITLRKKIQFLEIQILHKDREIKKNMVIDHHHVDGKEEDLITIADQAKTYLMTIKSKLVVDKKSFHTNKSLQQAINFFSQTSTVHLKALTNIFQPVPHHFISPSKHIHSKHVGEFSIYLPKRRKFELQTSQKQEIGQVAGSRDKKKRFERKNQLV